MNREMQKALEADGEKLRQLTGEDHGPWFIEDCPELNTALNTGPHTEQNMPENMDRQRKIAARATRDPRVSTHALLRYIERTIGIDMDAIRDEILTPEVCAALSEGATGVTVNGVKMVAENGVIVTVLGDDMRPKGQTKKRWRDLDAAALLAERERCAQIAENYEGGLSLNGDDIALKIRSGNVVPSGSANLSDCTNPEQDAEGGTM